MLYGRKCFFLRVSIGSSVNALSVGSGVIREFSFEYFLDRARRNSLVHGYLHNFKPEALNSIIREVNCIGFSTSIGTFSLFSPLQELRHFSELELRGDDMDGIWHVCFLCVMLFFMYI